MKKVRRKSQEEYVKTEKSGPLHQLRSRKVRLKGERYTAGLNGYFWLCRGCSPKEGSAKVSGPVQGKHEGLIVSLASVKTILKHLLTEVGADLAVSVVGAEIGQVRISRVADVPSPSTLCLHHQCPLREGRIQGTVFTKPTAVWARQSGCLCPRRSFSSSRNGLLRADLLRSGGHPVY